MLEIRGLSYRYRAAQHAALEDVSFSAQAGKVLGLLGPNGAGKTTLIGLLAGLLRMQRGEILLDGCTLAEVRATAPTRVALAPQEDAFYPMLSVHENLDCFAAAARLHGTRRRERIEACIAFGRLERHVDVRAERLSGGLRRRLSLALALLAQPQLILLDEPTAGVDPQSRAFLLDSVRALAAQGTTILYTSHYMEEIEAIADRVVILDHGRVLRDGPLADLLALDSASMSLQVDAADATRAAQSLAAYGHVRQDGAALTLLLDLRYRPTTVLDALDSAGIRPRRASYGQANLEQLFMALTERSLRDD